MVNVPRYVRDLICANTRAKANEVFKSHEVVKSVFNERLLGTLRYMIYNIFYRNQGENVLLDFDGRQTRDINADENLFDDVRRFIGLHNGNINFDAFAKTMAVFHGKGIRYTTDNIPYTYMGSLSDDFRGDLRRLIQQGNI